MGKSPDTVYCDDFISVKLYDPVTYFTLFIRSNKVAFFHDPVFSIVFNVLDLVPIIFFNRISSHRNYFASKFTIQILTF